MSNQVQFRGHSAPPIHPDTHRQIRLHRFGLPSATARLIAEHAFGDARDGLLVFATANAGILSEGVYR